MNKFIDKKNHLQWIKSNDLNIEEKAKISQEVNSWKSEDISRFICENQPLDDFLTNLTKNYFKTLPPNEILFYCFEDKDLIGALLLGHSRSAPHNYFIDYFAVNPNICRKGYASRMIKSIISNPEYFNNGTLPTSYHSNVAVPNVASSRVFIKNKFRIVSKVTSKTFPYYEYFYTLSPKALDKTL